MQELSAFIASYSELLLPTTLAALVVSFFAWTGAATGYRLGEMEGKKQRETSFTGASRSAGCSVAVLAGIAGIFVFGEIGTGDGSFMAGIALMIFLAVALVFAVIAAVVGGILAGVGAYLGAGTSARMASLLSAAAVFISTFVASFYYFG